MIYILFSKCKDLEKVEAYLGCKCVDARCVLRVGWSCYSRISHLRN